jgi:hypothetical protein
MVEDDNVKKEKANCKIKRWREIMDTDLNIFKKRVKIAK